MSVALITTNVTFTDSNGALVDPSTVTLNIRYPQGELRPWAGDIDNPSTGMFTAIVLCQEPGEYVFEWYGKLAGDDGLERTISTRRVVT